VVIAVLEIDDTVTVDEWATPRTRTSLFARPAGSVIA
jgi:hypothetical protein